MMFVLYFMIALFVGIVCPVAVIYFCTSLVCGYWLPVSPFEWHEVARFFLAFYVFIFVIVAFVGCIEAGG